MSKFGRFLMAILLLALVQTKSVGQAADEPEHRAIFPEGDAVWTVTFENKELTKRRKAEKAKNAEQQPDLKELKVVRQGKLRRDSVLWSNGKRSEYWWSNQARFIFFEVGADGSLRGIKASLMGAARYDETFFSWASEETYAGEKELEGKPYWHFKRTIPATFGDGKVVEHAWVDPETSRPYAWSNGVRTAFFAFETPEVMETLVLPPKFEEEFARYQEYLDGPQRVQRR